MFGKRLKKLREEKELTQEQLGKLVNLSQQTIGHYGADIDIYTVWDGSDIVHVGSPTPPLSELLELLKEEACVY